MAKILVTENNTTTAHFMLNENFTIRVQATHIGYMDGYASAFNGTNLMAEFRADRIIGCWLEGV